MSQETAPIEAAAPNSDTRTAEARAFVHAHPSPTSTEDPRNDAAQSAGPTAPLPGVTTQADDTALSRPHLPNSLGDKLTAGDVDRFAAIAKAAGMPTAYAQRALDFFASRIDARASTRPNRDDAVKTLRAEWGDAFRAKARAANHAMDVLGLRGAIQRAGLLDDVPLARYLADLGAWIAKNPAVPSRTQQARAELRGDVQRRYDEIMNAGPTHPYWSRRDPVAHKAAVAEVERLAAVLFGAGPANPDTEGTSRATADYGETLATRAVEAQRIMSSWLADPKHPVNNRHHAEHHEAVRHFQNLTRIIAQAQQEPHAAAILRQDINRATAPPRLGTGHASRRRG